MKTIENLAFKGGGVLGAAYAGVYRALQEVKLLGSDKRGPLSEIVHARSPVVTVYGNVKRVAGTSAGAIFATMVALGLRAEETEAVVTGTNFADFVDFDSQFAEDGGFLQGTKFLNWMKQFVYDNFGVLIGSPDPTFGELAAAIADPKKWNIPPGLLKDLHIFSRQVSPGRTVEFCAQSTPDVPISQAVRASMSIPFIFVPWAFQGDLGQRYPGLFFDGGTAFNFPVSAFDSGEANKKTLGFYLADLASYQQGMFELLVHMAMKATTPPPLSAVEASVVETMMEWALLADQRGYIGPFDQAPFVKSQLTDANGDKVDLVSVNKMLAAVSHARKLMKGPGGNRAAAAHFKKRKLITKEQSDFLTAIDKWYEAVCSVQNTPTNMVFDRDASRTIFIDTLGYIYFDFFLPDWDTANLIDSGYACTRSYLSFIMYS
ncbi:MAG TPA: patatin-like phospholipase family protein [Xanthobacteraceae bacterium]|nr:patatin-like phospholipase family protein [Xanthobacteraceae bacterium]